MGTTIKELFIDQRGVVVRLVNDPVGTCDGCVYRHIRPDDNYQGCKKLVPVEHLIDGSAALACVLRRKQYREVSANG